MADGKVVIETDLNSSGIQAELSKLSSIDQSGTKAPLTAIASEEAALASLDSTAVKVGENFAALTEQIKHCNGAAEEIAKIMQDNLKGSIEQLDGALEILGIELYESVDIPIRTIVDSATSMVEQLTKAFKDGGLSGLAKELSTVLAEVATEFRTDCKCSC